MIHVIVSEITTKQVFEASMKKNLRVFSEVRLPYQSHASPQEFADFEVAFEAFAGYARWRRTWPVLFRRP